MNKALDIVLAFQKIGIDIPDIEVFRNRWQKNYTSLEAFLLKEKRLPNRRSKNKEERRLGRWCKYVRWLEGAACPEKYRLLAHKKKQFDKFPEWKWNLRKDVWQERLEQVRRFVKKHKMLPKRRATDTQELSLAVWCQHQKEKSRRTPATRRKQLETIPGWDWSQSNEKA